MTLSISEQTKLLKRCIADNLDLDGELTRRGLTYDDLQYRHSALQGELFPDSALSGNLLQIEDLQRKRNEIQTVSFFSGCGGLDIGFHFAGFSNLLAIEKNALFCRSLRENKYTGRVIGPPDYAGDVKEREAIVDLLRSEIGLSRHGFSGVFHGGPPCQSFSIAANQRFSKNGSKFKRIGFSNSDYGTLLFDYVFYIKTLLPEVFIIENVAGLLTVDDGDQLSDALAQLRSVGYVVTDPVIINAADYQIPQNRMRVFIVGHRRKKSPFVFPEPNCLKVPCGKVFEMAISGVPNHITRKHKAESIIRYMDLGYGERDHLGRVDRLDPRLPSKTVIAGGSKGGGRSHLHPFIPRTLSVRESARLQTFPDSYVFTGTAARQFTQVGNAVPPLLAFHLATKIHDQLFA
jgi:DNA (cytosine-5)-methyltransferase 1